MNDSTVALDGKNHKFDVKMATIYLEGNDVAVAVYPCFFPIIMIVI